MVKTNVSLKLFCGNPIVYGGEETKLNYIAKIQLFLLKTKKFMFFLFHSDIYICTQVILSYERDYL